MSPPDTDDNQSKTRVEQGSDRYRAIRDTVRNLEADDIERQLPNLVEAVRNYSEPSEETMEFIIGVSFSKNESFLDYHLERLTRVEGHDRPVLETLKPAVSKDHMYLTFSYPPDPHFDARTLRGALLTEIEQKLSSMGQKRGGDDQSDDRGSEGGTRISNMWKQLGGSL